MSWASLAIALSGAGVLVTGTLAALFLRDPVAGMVATSHRAEQLPQVMANRYVAMLVLAVGATVYGDLKVIALLFAAFAYMAFHDSWIYARAGQAVSKHIGAGIAALIVFGVTVLAIGQGS
ncbi:hypothetical protein ROSMUCSMR3_00234 [Roseovarius mucosus]|uniref:Uncharacterized protein n=1 Tax=Roseovarius mucosus TaxID=215743 RepID=A0A1V0RJ13_9RHOB|nr:hypothetical protein [Roseovarius mucosus]ARE81744.1 hypothetical protein ROSMUCSMR3_00234 [Roseovarius mucosus]